MAISEQQRVGGRPKRARRGALQSIELIMLLPLLVILLFGCLQLSFLFSASSRLKAASEAACRVATMPAADTSQQLRHMRAAAEQVLEKASLVKNYELSLEPGQNTGDPVAVELRVAMEAATPDLLGPIFSLRGRELKARTVMRKE